jgi:hypothetical protein
MAKPMAQWGAGPAAQPSSGCAGSFPTDFTQATPYKDPATEKKAAEKKEKKRKQRREDAKTAVEWLMFFGVFNGLMWIVPLLGSGWQDQRFTGFGIGYTQVHTSILTITIETECHVMEWPFGINSDAMSKLSPEQHICKYAQHMNGTHSLHTAKDLACSMGKEACDSMQGLFYSNFFLLFAFVLSALVTVLAVLFLYFYWYVEHLKVIRQWSFILYVISPMPGTIAYIAYNVLGPNLGDVPRSWNHLAGTIAGGTGAFQIKATHDSWFAIVGWPWFFCWITIGFALAAPITFKYFFKPHADEKSHERKALREEDMMNEAVEEIEQQQDHVEMKASQAASAKDPYNTPSSNASTAAPSSYPGYVSSGYSDPSAYGPHSQPSSGGYPQQSPQYGGAHQYGGIVVVPPQPYQTQPQMAADGYTPAHQPQMQPQYGW